MIALDEESAPRREADVAKPGKAKAEAVGSHHHAPGGAGLNEGAGFIRGGWREWGAGQPQVITHAVAVLVGGGAARDEEGGHGHGKPWAGRRATGGAEGVRGAGVHGRGDGVEVGDGDDAAAKKAHAMR